MLVGICLGDTVKDQFGLYLFLKTQKYRSLSQRKKTIYDFNLPWAFYALPWDGEVWVKTVIRETSQVCEILIKIEFWKKFL